MIYFGFKTNLKWNKNINLFTNQVDFFLKMELKKFNIIRTTKYSLTKTHLDKNNKSFCIR
jgi:hypothetical protein